MTRRHRFSQNISALAIVARGFDGSAVKIFSLILNIFAVMTLSSASSSASVKPARGLP